jgi:F-type H+-transporting ATPase subunit gamma
MRNIRDIRKRIRSVRNIQQVTRAVQMISSVRLRKAQERMIAARPYSFKLKEILADIAARIELDSDPLFRRSEPKHVDLVLITGEKGLCGGFNTNVIREAARFSDELAKTQSVQVYLHLVGKKAREFFRKRSANIRKEYATAAIAAQYEDAREIAEGLASLFTSGQTDAVYFIFNEFKSIALQRIAVEQVLPLGAIAPIDGRMARIDYKYEPSKEVILKRLLPRHLSFQVYRILVESAAAEHAARMTAMDTATKNAAKMIDSLTLYMNKVRQASITRELIEVVSSAEALKETE